MNQNIPLSLVRKRQYGCGKDRAKTLYSRAAKLLGLDMRRMQKGGIDKKIWNRRLNYDFTFNAYSASISFQGNRYSGEGMGPIINQLLYILTIIWVLCNSNAVQNMLFQCFLVFFKFAPECWSRVFHLKTYFCL